MARQQAAAVKQGGRGLWLALGIVVILAAGGWWYFKRGTNVEPGAGPKPGVTVEVATAEQGSLSETLQVAGQVQASAGVELRSEVTGRVVAVKFKDGDGVKKNSPLIVLDDGVQRATLAQAQANSALAEANVGRYQRLMEVGAASKLQVDQAVAEAALQKANIQMAQVNLSKYRIAAPFDGLAGIAQVSAGDLVQPGELLVALTDNSALKVTFKVPEGQATSLQVGAPVVVKADGTPGDTSGTEVQGVIAALDGRVDPNSRTLEGKVLLQNPDNVMVAGQFVRVRVPVRNVSDAVIVPDQALIPVGNTTFAYVVAPGKDGVMMASKTTVEVGIRTANRVQILRGISAGQQVVTAGQQKMQAPTMPVKLQSPTAVEVPPAAVEELR